jgi:hypothetical protein
VGVIVFGAIASITYVQLQNTKKELAGVNKIIDALADLSKEYKQDYKTSEGQREELENRLNEANRYIFQTIKDSTLRNKLLTDPGFIPSIPEPEAVTAPPTMQRKASRVDAATASTQTIGKPQTTTYTAK